MEIGINMFLNNKYITFDEQIKFFKELGVNHTFIGKGQPSIDDAIETLNENNIICDNLHSEFTATLGDTKINMEDMHREGELGDIMLERLLDNVLTCKNNNIPILVVHAPGLPPEEALTELGDMRYKKLGDFARKHNVTIAFENTMYTENIAHMLKIVPDGKFCWDSGHEYRFQTGKRFVPLFGDKLCALHIHDNNFTEDSHLIPFEGKIDFDLAAKDLAESGYNGTMMLECIYKGTLPPDEYYRKAVTAERKLADMVESYS